MQDRYSNSPAFYLWLIALGGVVTAGAFLCLLPPIQHSTVDQLLLRLALFVCFIFSGLALQSAADRELRRRLDAGRWPPETTAGRFQSRAWVFLKFALLALSVASFIKYRWPYNPVGYAFLMLSMAVNTLRNSVLPRETPLPQIEPTNMTPLHSDHWGKT